MLHHVRRSLSLSLLAVVLVGCTEEAPSPAPRVTPPVTPPAAKKPRVQKVARQPKPTTAVPAKKKAAQAAAADKNQADKNQADKNQAEADGEATTAKELAFEPPFPSRVELFKPPSRRRVSRAKSDDGSGDLVLTGFTLVNLGKQPRPLAMFMIGGKPVMLGVGDRYGQLTVAAIAQPTVTLQRGRGANIVRWEVSLSSEID